LSGVTGGLGSIPKSSTPWAGSSSNSRARASSTPSSASVWAEPTCLTIRCRPSAYSAICTAVAPEAVRTRRMNATPPSLGHRLVRENALTPAHHRRSATCRPRKACPVSQLRSSGPSSAAVGHAVQRSTASYGGRRPTAARSAVEVEHQLLRPALDDPDRYAPVLGGQVAGGELDGGVGVARGRLRGHRQHLSWLIRLVRDFSAVDRVEDGLLFGGDGGREGLGGAVDRDGRRAQRT